MVVDLIQYEDVVYEAIQEYLSKNKALEVNLIIPYLHTKLSKGSEQLSHEGILRVVRILIQKKLVVEGYTLTREQILRNEKRNKIFEYIKNNPGCYFYRIVKELLIGSHVVIWHLNILHDFEFIKKVVVNKKDLYYSMDSSKKEAILYYYNNNDKSKEIIRYLKQNSQGITKTNLSNMLGMHPNTIKKYINLLFEAGIVSKQKAGNKDLHFLRE